MKNVGTGFRGGGVKGFKLCHDRICLIPPPPKPLNYSYDPPHWQFIAIQFPKVPPLYSVGDDWSLWSSLKSCIPFPLKRKKPFDSSPFDYDLLILYVKKVRGRGYSRNLLLTVVRGRFFVCFFFLDNKYGDCHSWTSYWASPVAHYLIKWWAPGLAHHRVSMA